MSLQRSTSRSIIYYKIKFTIVFLLPNFLYCQTVTPLSVGDSIPDLVLENVVNYPASKMRLSDLKGKMVILDFWGKYCAPCILTLHKLDSLQQIYREDIQVITISDHLEERELYKTLGRYKQTQNLKLPVILGNSRLIDYFPYKLVSHLVWIDGNGIIKAITGSEYVTSSNVQDVLSGKRINWPVKRDVQDFDYKKPLLDYMQVEESRPASIFYSTFTTHMSGIGPPSGTMIDSLRNVSVTAFYNYTLLSLCQMSVDYRVGASKNHFIFKVKDTARYIKPEGPQLALWKKMNTYCYYLQMPIKTSKEKLKEIIMADLSKWLFLMGITVNKVNDKYVITEESYVK